MKIRALTTIAMLLALVAAALMSGCGSSESSTWAALDSGKPAFYYFGAPS